MNTRKKQSLQEMLVGAMIQPSLDTTLVGSMIHMWILHDLTQTIPLDHDPLLAGSLHAQSQVTNNDQVTHVDSDWLAEVGRLIESLSVVLQLYKVTLDSVENAVSDWLMQTESSTWPPVVADVHGVGQ